MYNLGSIVIITITTQLTVIHSLHFRIMLYTCCEPCFAITFVFLLSSCLDAYFIRILVMVCSIIVLVEMEL
jgi:hypothetical protein